MKDPARSSHLQPLQRMLRSASSAGALSIALAVCMQTPARAQVAADGVDAPPEIVVTATRRAESVYKVPYNISAVSGDQLVDAGATSLADLTRLAPGISFLDQGGVSRGGNNNIVLRGLNANSAINNRDDPSKSSSTVATYLNDTPVFFTLSMLDMERVEVLRGPQGTLYGSGAMGGAIKFIARKPDLDEGLGGTLGAEASVTQDSGKLSYGVNGVLNIPVTSNFGLRLVGSQERSGGFIDALGRVKLDSNGVAERAVADDVASGYVLLPTQHDTNTTNHWFARATALYEPVSTVKLSLTYQHDHIHQDDVQLSSFGFAGGSVDASSAGYNSKFGNAAGCPAPTADAYGFVPVVCLGGNGAWMNGATVYPAAGRNQNLTPFAQPFTQDLDIVSGDIAVDMGFATFTSTTSYSRDEEDYTRDSTGFMSTTQLAGAFPVASLYGYFPRLLVYDLLHQKREIFTQEARFQSNWDKPWDYVVGGYYEHNRLKVNSASPWPGLSEFCSEIDTGTTCFGVPNVTSYNPDLGDLTFTEDSRQTFTDKSLFGQLTIHPTDAWQITGGIRHFWESIDFTSVQTLPFCGPDCADSALETSNPTLYNLGGTVVSNALDVDKTIFMANTSYLIDNRFTAYFTFSQGFRRGGINRLPASGYQASTAALQTFRPDFADNYEIGFKGVVNPMLSFDLALFMIDWKDFQFQTISAAGYTLTANGAKARSKGIELSVNLRPVRGLELNAGYAYTDAKLSSDTIVYDYSAGEGSALTAIASLAEGDRMPSVPRHSLTLSGNYHMALGSGALDWNVNGSFRSGSKGDFNATSASYIDLPSFWLWNAAVDFKSGGGWTAGLFIRNIFNAEGITGGLPSSVVGPTSQGAYITRPRTAGIRLSYDF